MLESLDLSAYAPDFLEFALDWLEDCQVINSGTIHGTVYKSIQFYWCVVMPSSLTVTGGPLWMLGYFLTLAGFD